MQWPGGSRSRDRRLVVGCSRWFCRSTRGRKGEGKIEATSCTTNQYSAFEVQLGIHLGLNKYPPQSNRKNEDHVRTTQSFMTSRHAQIEPEIALKYPMSHSKRLSQGIPRPQQTRGPPRQPQVPTELPRNGLDMLSERTYVSRPSRCAFRIVHPDPMSAKRRSQRRWKNRRCREGG
jgi:hypothetical protein